MAIAAKLSKEEFEIDESTKEYAKSLDKIANDRTLKMLTKSERENLKKIADLLAKEEVEIDEGNSAYDKQIAAFIAKGGKIKKLSVNKKEISKAAAEFKKKFKTMQQKEIELDIEDELERARNEEVEVAEAFKPHKMYEFVK